MTDGGNPASDQDGGTPSNRSAHDLLPSDLVALAQGGVSVVIGCCDRDGNPLSGIGLGARIDPAGCIRVFAKRATNAPLLAAIAEGARVAVTFSRAIDHASFQVKAHGAGVRDADPGDHPEILRQCMVFRDELIEIGLPPQVANSWVNADMADVVSISFRPCQAFMQTPGPGAGAPVAVP